MSTLSQRSFAAGEIGPPLYAHVDQSRYATGLRKCRNMMVMRHGGVTNRPGSQFVGEAKDSSKSVRLIPFVFNTDQAYILEFGDSYLRIVQDGSYIKESTKAITAITKANPGVVTSNSHGYLNGEELYLDGIVGMTELNGRNVRVANKSSNTFELHDLNGNNISTSAFTTYVSGGTAARIYTVATTYLEAELAAIQYVQSADVMTLTHQSHPPAELSRTGATSWALADITFGTSVIRPTSILYSGSAATASGINWQVVNVSDDNGEESAGKQTVIDGAAPTTVAPQTITWGSSSGTTKVFRSVQGVFGLIGYAKTGKFVDDGITPDFSESSRFNDLYVALTNDSSSYPSVVAYFQQRLLLANTVDFPESFAGSRTGTYHNFNAHLSARDDDAFLAALNSRQVNRIKHIIDLGKMVLFTSAGEWAVAGDANGTITPSSINMKQYSYYGANDLTPIVIGESAIYVQARGSIVRDLAFDISIDGYRGNELTIFSPHLVDNYSLVEWAYQLTPHSIVWAARSDGTMLGLTYVKEQQIIGWHRHDFDGGTVESVCCIPEGDEDILYVVVNRTVDGHTKRYIERLTTRKIDDVVDCIFMDSALSYDGRNATSTTMTLSGGTLWTDGETLTLTASASFFKTTDVGNAIYLTGSDGTLIRFTIGAYSSATVVTGNSNKDVPVAMQSVATLVWTRAVDELSGLWHLEGKDVSVFADGYVVASPNNADYDVITVTNGAITLDRPYGVIHVGLPYISDIETLDIDTPQGETVADKNKIINEVTLSVEKSRGIWAGPQPPSDDDTDPLEGMTELKARSLEGYDDPVALKTENVSIAIQSHWNSNGRVFVRQVDPLPMTILAVHPAGLVPFRGG